MNNFCADISTTFLISILLHLLVEEPFTQIGKHVTRNWSRQSEVNKIDDAKNNNATA